MKLFPITRYTATSPITLTVRDFGFDSTGVGATTWGSGSDFAWTFDIGAGTNPILGFSGSTFAFNGNDLTGTGNVVPVDGTKDSGSITNLWNDVHLDGRIGIINPGFYLNFDIGGNKFDFVTQNEDVVLQFTGASSSGLFTFESDNDLFILGSDAQLDGSLTVADDIDALAGAGHIRFNTKTGSRYIEFGDWGGSENLAAIEGNHFIYIRPQNAIVGWFSDSAGTQGFNIYMDKGFTFGQGGVGQASSRLFSDALNQDSVAEAPNQVVCLKMGLPSTGTNFGSEFAGNYLLIGDAVALNTTFNFAHDIQANPTIFLHSVNQATDEWISFTHDQIDGLIQTGTGNIILSPAGAVVVPSTTKLNFLDTAIGIYSQADTFLDLFADGGIRFGNSSAGAPTTYIIVEPDADTYWVGAGTGLPYGSFWGNELGFVSAGGTGTFFEISDASITVGQTNLTTFQNNQELAVAKAGVYQVVWSMSVKATGANKHIVGGIGVDVPGGADALVIQNDGRNHAVSTGNAEFGIAGTAILDLAASSEVGLMATNETDGTNVTVEHVSLSIIQIGGT